jgi:hypothetical protein
MELRDCDHPESMWYVLALDDSKPITEEWPTILWCRACGAVKGWKPAFKRGTGEWQLPDGEAPTAEEEAEMMEMLQNADDILEGRHRS